MKRAVLVFLKHPTPGRVKTRLAADLGEEAAALAYRQLVSRVLEKCRQAKPDVLAIAYDPPDRKEGIQSWLEPWLRAFPGRIEWIPQSEGDLGQRLEAATGDVFKRLGLASLAVIGTDCVHLDSELFEKCWNALNDDTDAVFGPTEDGGYYLVGMRKPLPVLFRGIPWSSDETLQSSLVAAISANLRILLLPVLFDVDTEDDWRRVESEVSGRKCVFFDRDGVVNRSPGPGYVLSLDDFELNPGIAEAIRRVKERDYLAILATSQRGVGKGLMSQAELEAIHRHMQNELQIDGAEFDGIYAYTETEDCPYPPKPDPGMIEAGIESFFIDRRHSWMIGDADRDIEMGKAAGLRGTIRIKGEKAITVPADHTLENTVEIPDLLEKVL